MIALTTGVHAQPAKESPEQLREQLEQLRQQIAEISTELDRSRKLREQELAALADIERQLGEIGARLRSTLEARDAARARARELDDQASALEHEIARLTEALHAQLGVAYRIGAQSRLRVLLNREDPARISRLLGLHGYLARTRMRLLDELSRTRARLEQTRHEQQETARRLDTLATELETLRQRQTEALAQRQSAVAALDSRIRERGGVLAELNQSARELEDLIERLATALADIPQDFAVAPFPALRGKLPMPVDGPVLGAFSTRTTEGTLREGWLIGAEHGAPVRAIAHGRVAWADWLRGYGMLVIIDHGEGWMSLYGRNQSLLVAVGDWVTPGTVIALAGASGGNETPGLYFQLRHEGRPVDPAGWIKR